MKIIVTPQCRHYNDHVLMYSNDGDPFIGTRLSMNERQVRVDGRAVLVFEQGTDLPFHNWRTAEGRPFDYFWTGFRVTVEP